MTTLQHARFGYALGLILAFSSMTSPSLRAQAASVDPATSASRTTADDDQETIVLSPFVVTSDEDAGGYGATSTLAGTRVRTDLRDVASSLSVVTGQFLRDTGATNNQTLLQYTANTEVGGVYGNFAGVGSTFTEGATENFAPPHLNTRVRGLDSADNTRDYFRSDIPWDSYNVGRVDIQRGPNSILFGIGSPAGIINASLNSANFANAYSFENRIGSYGSLRNSADLNHVLVDKQLAIRIALLDDHSQYRQEPAFSRSKRAYGALNWEPELFNRASAHTSLRMNIERGYTRSNAPRILPPVDYMEGFFDANGANRTAYDPYYSTLAGIVPSPDQPPLAGEIRNYWLVQNYGGSAVGTGATFRYDHAATGAAAGLNAYGPAPGGSGPNTRWGISSSGTFDKQIDGYPYAAAAGLGNYNQYTIAVNRLNPTLFPGAGSGFYKSKVLTDPTIFDFYNQLIDGPNKREWQDWTAFNVTLDQTFLDHRLGFQLAYDKQDYDQGGEGGVANLIAIDVQANVNSLPSPYGGVAKYNGTGTAGTNPNAGRAYMAGGGANAGSAQQTTRESVRFTAMGEVRATDFMSRSLLSEVLGRHVFTGLYNKDSYEQLQRSWDLYALDAAWDTQLGTGPGAEGEGLAQLKENSRVISWRSYVSDPLFNASSAQGAHFQPLTSEIRPSGTANITYFDSHWKHSLNPASAGYVDPAAPWTNPTVISGATQASTESENPANYVGWQTRAFDILRADEGDIDSLYRRGAKLKQVITSEALTWQGNFWDGTLAATYGWRRDEQTQRSGNAVVSPITGAADMNFDLAPTQSKSRGTSKSWGLVLHEPKAIRGRLPAGTNFSLHYSHGENTRVENRYGFEGNPLPNAKGSTKDYGFTVSTLDDRLQLKVTWYETKVSDANISSLPTAESTLGANAYYLWLLPAWGLGDVLQAVAGMAGDPAANGSAYNWNWAASAHPDQPIYQDVTSSEFQNDPATISERAAIASFLGQLDQYYPQAWWDAYGYPVNVAEAKAGNYRTAVRGWTVAQGNWAINPAGGGSINGSAPVGTVDYLSKGIEFELVGKLRANWNVAVNVSKQRAYQSALGQQLVDFITAQSEFYASPAGDIRLWWGGDQGIGDYFEQNIGGAFRFQQQTNGKLTPEMAPWRANAVTTYTFDRGRLKGAFIGAGHRWAQGHILGYALNEARDNLDVDRPYWSGSQSSTDLWVGYERKLGRKFDWRIQLNLRSVGEKAHLEPLSVQPDGTPAVYTIRDGMTWTLTNTIQF